MFDTGPRIAVIKAVGILTITLIATNIRSTYGNPDKFANKLVSIVSEETYRRNSEYVLEHTHPDIRADLDLFLRNSIASDKSNSTIDRKLVGTAKQGIKSTYVFNTSSSTYTHKLYAIFEFEKGIMTSFKIYPLKELQ